MKFAMVEKMAKFETGHKVNLKHGMARTKIYKVWSSMKERCLNPSHQAYERYGGRGITVCDRWLVFENFFCDMGMPPKGFSLDRSNNNLGYSPENCRWVSKKEQQINTRAAHIINHDGFSLTVSDWARKLGVSRNRITSRINRGMSERDALKTEKINPWETRKRRNNG